MPTTPQEKASVHSDFLKQVAPEWLIDATPARRAAMKNTRALLPDWYRRASLVQQQALSERFNASFTSQTRLDKTMSALQDVEAFAEPLLIKALKDQFGVEVDVNRTLLCLRRPLEVGELEIEVASFEVLKLSLLQAALHNFEASEIEEGAFHKTSAFVVETSTPGTFQPVTVSVTIRQFLSLCRGLDIGAKYQTYIKAFFQPVDATVETTLRQQFISSQKAAMRAAAELALLKKDIEPKDYTMILSVIDGEVHPWQDHKQVWFRDLSLMKRRMTGCVVFGICEKYRYSDELVVYIPHDPEHPLKRYTLAQLRGEFKRQFTLHNTSQSSGDGPTAHQRFFSQFVAYADRPYYFSQFTRKAPDSPVEPLHSVWVKVIQLIPPFSTIGRIKELPPERQGKREPVDDPYLDPVDITRAGAAGIWSDNTDLWNYLYEKNRDKVIADARRHAVPTDDVDAKVRAEKIGHLLEVGLFALNMVSMFVPVLGEVMMTVMAGQLMYESFEGAIEWSEGDRTAAKAHLIDVAENLAMIGAMAGGANVLGKLTAVKPEPVVERLDEITCPDGQTRLWQPSLSGYERDVMLDRSTGPNPLGQHLIEGKTYIRQEGKVYETTFDEPLGKWRITHPTDAQAYQPVLEHNGLGAWRHTLERPREWDRLTLLRRMGHVTETFTDEQLLRIADVSGVDGNALRKMQVDHLPPPPELADTLRLFEADVGVAQVIEQVRSGQSIDGRYLTALPLVTELPRWPMGRVLEVFEGSGLSGSSVKYGAGHLLPEAGGKAPIRITRTDVLNGELPARILGGLDESEITWLLGGEPARVSEGRTRELAKQLADFLQTRQPALFEKLYTGTGPVETRVAMLQRACPRLGVSAARRVLLDANAEELTRLDTTRRVPLKMLEEARWYAQQGRLSQAFAGLHMESMTSADSKWLALRALEKLPGWSGEVRLEIREGDIGGLLIDGIGSEIAASRKYLVKNGSVYQAFNERGEALHSVPSHGDNFFASIMHALPDKSRQALDFPQVGQSSNLRRAVIDSAIEHRAELGHLLEKRAGRRRMFKPPVRVQERLVGYYASGRGQGVNPSLTTRVQDVYTGLTDQQANGFILKQLRAGKTDAQIYSFLQARMREWEALESTLDQWVGDSVSDSVLRSMLGGKAAVARNIKESWLNSPLIEEHPRLRSLDVICDDPLPSLSADFSHVHDLNLWGRCVTDANVDAILGSFPELKSLRINATGDQFSNVPEALSGMQKLTGLSLYSAAPFAVDMPSRLGALTMLEELSVYSSGFAPMELDVSRMRNLRKLEVIAPSLYQWPVGVLELTQLERLNLKGTGIRTLPDGVFEGHEQLWSGLSLDWSIFLRENFKPAYEYVKNHPEHLVDLEEMVRDYCKGELRRLGEGMNEPSGVFNRFVEQWPGAEARFEAVEALSDEHGVLERQLNEWTGRLLRRPMDIKEILGRSWATTAIKACWRNGAFKRYGLTVDTSVLELPNLDVSEFPELPAGAFSHVQTLYLKGGQASAEQFRGFVRGFTELRTLDLSANGLTEVPIAPGELGKLTRLDLSGNRIVAGPGVQQAFDGLRTLEFLDLSNNPLDSLDVSGMTRLKALNLRATDLHEWPMGAQDLQQLTWLDLRGSKISALPEAVLRDDVLIKTNLTGTPLAPQAMAALTATQQRIELAKGLPTGALGRFALEEVPPSFPPAESGFSIARHLLPLPDVPVGEGSAHFVKRLQRLNPMLADNDALNVIEQLRESGVTDLQISERFAGWDQTFESLTRRLNGWLYTRESRGAGWIVSSESRRLAALRILECWREGLIGGDGVAHAVLNLNGLQLGDLPELPAVFSHVGTLNLTGVKLSRQGSDGFLKAFTQLKTLELNGNELEAVPEVIQDMTRLERLELSGNRFNDPEHLYSSLNRLERLKWLDLSYNELDAFDVGVFERLVTLDLRNNNLTAWPEGVLDANDLGTLNLSRNDITSIPSLALEGSHEALMSGTDLTDNYNVALESLERLRDYREAGARDTVLGISRNELDELIAGATGGDESESESFESDEDLPDEVPDSDQKTPWLANATPEELVTREPIWNQLKAEPDNGAFFHLLMRLQDTREFRVANADLTRRVWTVMEAAASSTELREVLFASSNTHGTCVDGRVLTFSVLESKVFTHNALLDIPPGRPGAKGDALLKLSRQLFRLDKVDDLATKAAARAGQDEAEVRLGYRIGLTGGWSDGLELPGQPKHMTYGSGVTSAQLAEARIEVINAERSEAFFDDLIQRDYWVDYLKERYLEDFSALDENDVNQRNRLEENHQTFDEAYSEAAHRLEIELTIERNQKLVALSRKEVQNVERSVSAVPQPGPSRKIME